MEKLRVLIVDDHPVTRDGLRVALRRADDMEVVGEAATGEDAIRQVDDIRPDVVLMDVRMPGMGGIEATKVIKQRHPHTRVVIFTVDESRASLSAALDAGVSGYLLKDADVQHVITAARFAMEGKAVIDPSLTKTFLEEVRLIEKTVTPVLSPREMEIIQRVAHGATTKEVAADLGLSAHTVKTHLERIFEKLGAKDRAQAVAIALRRGLVQ